MIKKKKERIFMYKNIRKRLLAVLLSVVYIFSIVPTASAFWEDGFVIPSQEDISSSFEDSGGFEWEWETGVTEDWDWIDIPTIDETDTPTVGDGSTIADIWDDIVDTVPERDTNIEELNIPSVSTETEEVSVVTSGEAVLSNNYYDIFPNVKERSVEGSDPWGYTQAGDGKVTIVVDRFLNNILHYDGKIVDNIHIAKWVKDNPAELEFPAYCKDPGLAGVAQHTQKQYQIDPYEYIGDTEKRIMGVARAGFPYKTLQELGVNDVEEAYYATNGAIHTAIINGDLNNWEIRSSDPDRNTRVLNALKKIYMEGITQPYTPPAIKVNFVPVSGDETAIEDGEWVSNTYEFRTSYPYNDWGFYTNSDVLNGMIENGEMELLVNGSKVNLQTGIRGSWDTSKGVKIANGQSIEVRYKKSLAEATGADFTFTGTIVDVDFENCITFLGNPTISGNWQGYIYNTVPYAADKTKFLYNKKDVPEIPEPDPENPDPEQPDEPMENGEGSLVIEKLDWNTKDTVADAVFHIKGISKSCSYINVAIKASRGATLPVIHGATIDVSDGVITITGIPAGTYEITEISPPPHFDVAVGQNSQSVEVVNDASVHPKVIFENKEYGRLEIVKIDRFDQSKLEGVYFKVENKDTGFEQTVVTDTSGSAAVKDIPAGTYVITEIASKLGYITTNQEYSAAVDWGETTSITIENDKKPSIEIIKIDGETSNPIAGVSFEVTHKNSGDSFSVTTDTNGKIALEGIEEGWYEVREVAPAPGYIANNIIEEIYAESGKENSITIKNTKKAGITIEKVDVHGNGLEGVSFNIYRFGENTPIPNSPITTGADGTAKIENIEPGHYQIQEVAALDGYLLDDTKYDLVVEEGIEQNTIIKVVNKRLPDLTIRKVDETNPEQGLPGAMFEVKQVDGQALPGSPYTSGEDGIVKIEDVPLGKYIITEIKAPDGYDISNPPMQYVTMEADKDVIITFTNDKSPDLTIRKADQKNPEQGLVGAMFEVKQVDGQVVPGSPFTTGEDGSFTIEDLPLGKYIITEIKPPTGYELSEANVQYATLETGKDVVLTFTNLTTPDLTVKKVDKTDPSQGLSGAVFEIKEVDGQKVAGSPFTTSVDGTFTIKDIKPGKYIITEIQAPDGYELSDPVTQYVTMEAGKDIEILFINDTSPDLTIQKFDKQTGNPLSGAVFEIEKLEEPNKGTITGSPFTTDAKGEIYIPNLTPGSYKLTEIKAPENYVIDAQERIITLKEGEDFVAKFENIRKPSIMIHKVDSVTKDPLKGAKFKISKAVNDSLDGEIKEIGTYVTDEKGQFTLNYAEPGWYRFEEIQAPAGYIIKGPVKQDIFLTAGEDKELTFENTPKSAIVIKKVDADTGEALAGAKFKLVHTSAGGSGTEGVTIGEYVTSHNGTIVVAGLKPGTYIVEELQAPDGYIMTDAAETVYLEDGDSSVVTVEIANSARAGLLIKKFDSLTKEPLAEAVFKVTDSRGAVVGDSDGLFRTNERGTIFIPNIKPGAYVVEEVQCPEGYILDNTPQTIHVEYNRVHSLEFFNQPLNDFIITKMDSVTKQPLAGAVVKITTVDDQFIGEYHTDKDGIISIKDLKPGTYKVQEIKAPDGYILDDTVHLVHLKQNEPQKVELYNNPTNGFVIVKMDGNTKEPLADAVIKVSTIEGTLIGEYRTDATGMITIKGLLPGNYHVQEVKQPDGYVMDDTVHLVVLKQDKPQKLELFNYKKAAMILQKVDKTTQKPLEGAKLKVTKINGEFIGEYITGTEGTAIVPSLAPGWYTVTEIAAPKGYNIDTVSSKNVEVKTFEPVTVKFENYKNATLRIEKTDFITKKPIENIEFSITRSDGKTFGKYRTDKRGEINLENQLPAGTYLIRETQTVKGYALDTNVRKITLNWGEDKLIEWENYPLASIEIEKLDKESGKPISGVKFRVLDSGKKQLGEYTTDSQGKISLEDMFIEGTYYIQEQELEGYLPNTGLQTVKTKWGKTTDITIENQPIMGRVKIEKVSADNNPINGILKGQGLENAEFTIYDSEGNEVEVLKTDKKGFAVSKKLRYGEYTMKETKTPTYYLNEEEAISFNIEKDGETVNIRRENKSTLLQTNVEKSGYQEVMSGDTIRYDIFHIQNLSLVPLNNFYLHESIPSDATRITRLFTGTYNQNLNYTILYKTNKNSTFKVLKDNLFTDRVYEIDCTQGLQTGEYVTDIKFEFGTVEVGFREVERPFLYCKVNENLPDKYQFTNRAEVGGTYEMQTVKTEDNFTTIVYVPAPENKGKLPKTGY